jgi:hypothetical protein
MSKIEKMTRLSFILFSAALVSLTIHNALYGIWRVEEAVFSLLALTLFVAFLVSVMWNIVTFLRFGWPADIWKIGFIGAFGLIGLVPDIGCNFFAFFVLFGLFILRPRVVATNAKR